MYFVLFLVELYVAHPALEILEALYIGRVVAEEDRLCDAEGARC